MFGICNLAMIPLRLEHSDKSEIVSQVLFGEHFEITEQIKQWYHIKLHYDSYEGWVDSKQIQLISVSDFNQLSNDAIILNRVHHHSIGFVNAYTSWMFTILFKSY